MCEVGTRTRRRTAVSRRTMRRKGRQTAEEPPRVARRTGAAVTGRGAAKHSEVTLNNRIVKMGPFYHPFFGDAAWSQLGPESKVVRSAGLQFAFYDQLYY